MFTTPIHPALSFSFQDLVQGLETWVQEGSILRSDSIQANGKVLSIYNYSKGCQFARNWNQWTVMARGLILEHESVDNRTTGRIIAIPFPKFFNATEQEGAKSVRFDDSGFDIFKKMDGSLGIVYHYDGSWRVATRGSLNSDQAAWATNWINERPQILAALDKDVTYLCEIIYEANRIVISYDFEGLVMLGAYNRITGHELSYDSLDGLCGKVEMQIAQRYNYTTFEQIVDVLKVLPGTEEGFVIRFRETGDRVKMKGEEYCVLHRLISNITPLSIWNLLVLGHDMDSYKASMPEEFWGDIDNMLSFFMRKRDEIFQAVLVAAKSVEHLSDKELGLFLKSESSRKEIPWSLVFPLRKKGEEVVKQTILQHIRPTGNVCA